MDISEITAASELQHVGRPNALSSALNDAIDKKDESSSLFIIMKINFLLGVTDFFLREDDFIPLLRHLAKQCGVLHISLNKPHVDDRNLIHSVEWNGIRMISISNRPILLT